MDDHVKIHRVCTDLVRPCPLPDCHEEFLPGTESNPLVVLIESPDPKIRKFVIEETKRRLVDLMAHHIQNLKWGERNHRKQILVVLAAFPDQGWPGLIKEFGSKSGHLNNWVIAEILTSHKNQSLPHLLAGLKSDDSMIVGGVNRSAADLAKRLS
jgi:hypothetical protein